MALPRPEPGLVVHYDYLWFRDAADGLEHGKSRPACLVAAVDTSVSAHFVVLLPITHSRPARDTAAIEIPEKVRRAVGLDDAPCWVIISEHNVDTWPNAGLSRVPGRSGAFSYGVIPPGLFARIKAQFLAQADRGRSAGVRR